MLYSEIVLFEKQVYDVNKKLFVALPWELYENWEKKIPPKEMPGQKQWSLGKLNDLWGEWSVETWSVYQVLSCRFNTGISWDQCPLNFMSVNYNQLKFQSTFTKKTDILENVCVGGEDSKMTERLYRKRTLGILQIINQILDTILLRATSRSSVRLAPKIPNYIVHVFDYDKMRSF